MKADLFVLKWPRSHLGLFVDVKQCAASYRLRVCIPMWFHIDNPRQRGFLDVRLWGRVIHVFSQIVVLVIHCIASTTSRRRRQRPSTAPRSSHTTLWGRLAQIGHSVPSTINYRIVMIYIHDIYPIFSASRILDIYPIFSTSKISDISCRK